MRVVTRRWRTGLGLTEILLGTFLLGLLAIPLMELMEKLMHRTSLTRLRVVARSLARNVIERYRLEPLAELRREMAGGRGEEQLAIDPLLALPQGVLVELVAAHRMRRQVSLAAAGDGPGAGRKAVLEVRVTWTEDGRERDLTVRTLIVDPHFRTGVPEDGAEVSS